MDVFLCLAAVVAVMVSTRFVKGHRPATKSVPVERRDQPQTPEPVFNIRPQRWWLQ
jgi:hypothetical protein